MGDGCGQPMGPKQQFSVFQLIRFHRSHTDRIFHFIPAISDELHEISKIALIFARKCIRATVPVCSNWVEDSKKLEMSVELGVTGQPNGGQHALENDLLFNGKTCAEQTASGKRTQTHALKALVSNRLFSSLAKNFIAFIIISNF